MDIKIESTFSLNVKQTPNCIVERCQTICTSSCGMVVVGFQSGFHVFRTAAFESACQKKTDDLRRNPDRCFPSNKHLDQFVFDQTVNIPNKLNILFISISCDGSTLAVILQRTQLSQPLILFYNTRTLFQQSPHPILQVVDQQISPHDFPTDVIWNPDQENRLMICLNGGIVVVISLLENGTKYAAHKLTKMKSTAIAWSPRGKRIMVFGEGGYLEQYDAMKMTSVRLIDIQLFLPPKHIICDILWFNNFSYILCATTKNRDLTNPLILFVHAPKEGPLSVKSFEDICFPSDSVSPIPVNQFYMQWCAPWRFAVLMSNRSSEIGVISVSENSKDCSLLSIDEDDGVIFKDGTRFTGFTMDKTVQTRGKGPLLYGVTSDGQILCQFMNRGVNHPSPCVPPTALPKATTHQLSAQGYGENQNPRSNFSPQATSDSTISKPFSPLSTNISPSRSSITTPPKLVSTSMMPSSVGSSKLSSILESAKTPPNTSAVSPKMSSMLGNIETQKSISTATNKQITSSPQINRSPRVGSTSNPATMKALNDLVLSVSERVNKSLSANRELFATIDRQLPSSTRGEMKSQHTPLTELQIQGDKLERRLEALGTVTTEARNNILQLNSESAANLEYVERVTVAMRHRHQSSGGNLFTNLESAPIDPSFSHHLREMHSRVDNFEMLLDQANHQLDSLLSSAESSVSERRRRYPGSASYGNSNGMEDPKMHQLYAALRTNAGALSVQESRVGEIAKLVDRLSLQNVSNGVSNGSVTPQQKRPLDSSRGSTFERDPASERSPAARRGWSTERDSVLMRMLSGRKDIPHVKSSPVNTSRSDDEKALYKKLDFSTLDEPSKQRTILHTHDSKREEEFGKKDFDSQSYSSISVPKSPLTKTLSSSISPRQSYQSDSSEKHVTFAESNTKQGSIPTSNTPAPTSILKSSTDGGLGKTFPEQLSVQNRMVPTNKTVISPNPLSNIPSQQESKSVRSFFPATSLSTSSASAAAAHILSNVKASSVSPIPVISKPASPLGIPAMTLTTTPPSSSLSPRLTGSKPQSPLVLPERSMTSVSPISTQILSATGHERNMTPSFQISTSNSKALDTSSGTHHLSQGDSRSVTFNTQSSSPNVPLNTSIQGLSTGVSPTAFASSTKLGVGVGGTVPGHVTRESAMNTPTTLSAAPEGLFKHLSSSIPTSVTSVTTNALSTIQHSSSPQPTQSFSFKNPTPTMPPQSGSRSSFGSTVSPAASSTVLPVSPVVSNLQVSRKSESPAAISPHLSSSAAPSSGGLFAVNPSSTAGTSLFSSPTPNAGFFATAKTTAALATAGGSLFNTGNVGEQNTGLFSKSTAEPGKPSSLFQTSSSQSTFTSSSSTVGGSNSLFGGSTTPPGKIFTSSATSSQPGSLFSPPASSSSTNNIFNSNPNTTSSASSLGLFGQPAKNMQESTSNIQSGAQSPFNSFSNQPSQSLFQSSFGQSSASNTPPMGLFGNTSNSPAGSGSVGKTGSLFSNPTPTTNAPSSNTLFGSPSQVSATGTSNPQSSSSLFGSPSQGNTTMSNPQGSTLFGSQLQGSTSAANPQSPNTLFGSNTQAITTGSGLFGGTGASSGSLFTGLGAAPPAEVKNVFGSPSPAAQSSQPAGYPSLFGASQSSPFGVASTGMSGGGGGLFGSTTSPAQAQNPTSAGFGAPPSFGGSPVFGASPAFGGMGGTSAFGDTRPAGGFAAVANQSSGLTFGSLAHGSSAPTVSGFGGQPAATPQMFGSPNTGASSEFSGNPSFTRRRA